MNTLKDMECAVSQISPERLAAFSAWFVEFDAAAWNKNIEEDLFTVPLDKLSKKALKDLREGGCKDLENP